MMSVSDNTQNPALSVPAGTDTNDCGVQVMTLTTAVEGRLLTAHPWAARTFLATLRKESGCGLAHAQAVRLDESLRDIQYARPDQEQALAWLAAGFAIGSTPLQDSLALLDFATVAIFTASRSLTINIFDL